MGSSGPGLGPAVKTRTILISGNGIAGPTLAYWLARQGFAPTLIEHAPAPRAGGYMIDFWGVGFDVAERMGLVPALRSEGYDFEEVRLVDADGRAVGGLDGNLFRKALRGRFLSIQRGELARLIFQAIDPPVESLYGDSIRAMSVDEDGVVVGFEHAPPRRFDLVVGADGLHSVVRSIAFGAESSYEKWLGFHTASFVADRYPHRDDGVYVAYTFPGAQVARYSMRRGRTAFFFVFRDPLEPHLNRHDLAGRKAALADVFARDAWECREIMAALAEADELYFDAVSQIRMGAWSTGRVSLVGDAAFCPSLLAGQGAAFAMLGAYVLAGELKRSGGDHRIACLAYHKMLRPFIERKQRAAAHFGGWFAPRTRVGIIVRNATTRLISLPFVANGFIRYAFGDRFEVPDYD